MKQKDQLLLVELREKFFQTQTRLGKAVSSGRFYQWSRLKKQEVFKRLQRYSQRLGEAIKPGLAAALITAGILTGQSAQGQSYAQQTGAANPLNLKSVSANSKPAFTDIDNDGDLDLYAGQDYANAMIFTNAGTAASPSFSAPVQFRFTADMYASPAFVDVDNDGDKDLFIGIDNGTIIYYPNTGTAAAAVYPNYPVAGASNPLNGINVASYASPVFIDIDNDGDKDLFIGSGNGSIFYYKNTGTVSAPVFTLQSGGSNPLSGFSGQTFSAPAFCDVDRDGDQDVLIGTLTGFVYYKNTGTVSAPVYTVQLGAASPFNGVTNFGNNAPVFADPDNNGTLDLVIGQSNGTFAYYKNTSTLPLKWQSFNAQKQNNKQVLLQWGTYFEQNTLDFTIQQSIDGSSWKNIGKVLASGNSSITKTYSFVDIAPDAGINYYRIAQHDINGATSLSEVKEIRFTGKDNSYTIANHLITNGQLQIEVNSALPVQLFNAGGQLLKQYELARGTQLLNLSIFSKGVYFLKVAGKTESFIIQ